MPTTGEDVRPKVLLVHHFFHPDEVVSSRVYADLAEDLVRRGWDVTVLTSNRSYLGDRTFPRRESWKGVTVVRTYRPPWSQTRALSRLSNSAWLIFGWLLEIPWLGQFDVILVGSDPAFLPLLLLLLRPLQPHSKFVHWCFDLYPEAIVADGMDVTARSLAPLARRLMRAAYARCAAVVDLGPAMRRLLARYGTVQRQETLVPWAPVEPAADLPDSRIRAKLFPGAKLALLYAGTLGRAHDYEAFLALARRCRQMSGNDVSFCFVARGARIESLRSALVPADTNVRIVPFCEDAELPSWLQAPDMHLLSVRPEWDGIVVPSKFFGSLAARRPVLLAGSERSDIAQWIAELDVGLVVNTQTVDSVADRLLQLIQDPSDFSRWRANAAAAHASRFSRHVVTSAWDVLLRDLVRLER
jgi:glycosyltransferase involved in cell wall biosynthesis